MRDIVKKAMVIAVLLGVSSSASAMVSIRWDNQGMFFHDAVAAGNQISADVLHILIWSPNNAPGFDYAMPGTGIGDNEWVLFQGNNADLGATFDYDRYTYDNSDVGGNDILNGYVYSRIFSQPSASAGDFYYQSGPARVLGSPLTEYDPDTQPPDPGQLMTHTTSLAATYVMGVGDDMYTVIPEPSVFALLGLGGLFLAIRRRFVNKK